MGARADQKISISNYWEVNLKGIEQHGTINRIECDSGEPKGKQTGHGGKAGKWGKREINRGPSPEGRPNSGGNRENQGN